MVSRLVSWAPERFTAYAFLSSPYFKPGMPTNGENFQDMLKKLKAMAGSELYGYMPFLAADESDAVIRAHVGSHGLIYLPD